MRNWESRATPALPVCQSGCRTGRPPGPPRFVRSPSSQSLSSSSSPLPSLPSPWPSGICHGRSPIGVCNIANAVSCAYPGNVPYVSESSEVVVDNEKLSLLQKHVFCTSTDCTQHIADLLRSAPALQRDSARPASCSGRASILGRLKAVSAIVWGRGHR